MKKKHLLQLCFMMAFNCAFAQSDFTIGVNDTLLVYPNLMAYDITFPVGACFNGYVDEWTVNFVCPQGMRARLYTTGNDMTITYFNNYHVEDMLVAPLSVNFNSTQVSSKIQTQGYWIHNSQGDWECYGTVKWGAGNYADMFDVTFQFDSDFQGDTLNISGIIKSGPDTRQGLVSPNATAFSRTVIVIVGYRLGDVNGDGVLNNADVTALIAYVLDGGSTIVWDNYQITAADINHDGYINTADVTALIQMVLSQ